MSEVEGRDADGQQEARVRTAVASWRDGLINLTGSNRLLNFKPRKTSAVTITYPSSVEVMRKLDAKATFEFEPLTEPEADDEAGPGDRRDQPVGAGSRRRQREHLLETDLSRPELGKALRNLLRRSNQDYLDRGVWILYLGIGTLDWDDETGARFTSPLLLLPVELEAKGPKALPFLNAADEDPVVNPALALRLSQLDLTLPTIDELDDVEPEELLAVFRSAVRSKESWRVEDSVVLSYFTFAKEAMYRDLLDNEQQIAEHPAIEALAIGGRGADVGDFDFEPVSDAEIDRRVGVDGPPLVLDADSSQRACVAAAVEGRSFVMDGPPGTGKSQTIANMIGALLHAGRTVLFVSEKAAALDVVRDRLTGVGLDSHLLELHSHKATRKQVAQTLGEALESRPVPPDPLSALDLDQLKRRQEQLNRYAEAINAERAPLGESLHTVLGWIAQLNDAPAAPMAGIEPADLTVDGLADARRATRGLARAWRPAEQGTSFVWRGVTEHRSMEARLYAAVQAVERLRSTANADTALVEAFGLPAPHQARTVAALLEQCATRPESVPDEWLRVEDFASVVSVICRMTRALRELTDARDELSRRAGVSWSAIPAPADLPTDLLDGRAARDPDAIDVDDLSAARANSLAERLDGDITMLEKRRASLDRIAGMLPMPSPETFDDADNLLALADIALGDDRPERAWLTDGTGEARHGRDELRAAAERLAAAEAHGSAFYQASALDRDIAGLHRRFTTEHRGLRKLGGTYRRDKREVAALARPDVRRHETLANLQAAVSWKDADGAYQAAESQYSALLGSYYDGRSTDYPRLERALANADEAIRRCGVRIAGVAPCIARDATPDPQLAHEVSATRAALDGWRSGLAPAPAAAPRPELLSRTIGEALGWLRAEVAELRVAANVANAVTTTLGRELTFGEARHLLAMRAAADDAGRALDRDEFQQTCGALFAGDRTSSDAVEAAAAWARAMRSIATGTDRALDQAQVEALRETAPPEALQEAIDAWERTQHAVLESFDASRRRQLREEFDDYDDAAGLLDDLRNDTAGQDEWFAYTECRAALDKLGLDGAVEFCIAERMPATRVPMVLDKTLLKEWADHQIATDPDLEVTRAEDRNAIVTEYRALDQRSVETAVSDILRECNARRPRTGIGQTAIIRREADKKRRHMPVRQLLERTSAVTQLIKPCFMMSPLAVSQYLPSGLRFDVVIFDEASQVSPEDAINCIYRGAALVTAVTRSSFRPRGSSPASKTTATSGPRRPTIPGTSIQSSTSPRRREHFRA